MKMQRLLIKNYKSLFTDSVIYYIYLLFLCAYPSLCNKKHKKNEPQ